MAMLQRPLPIQVNAMLLNEFSKRHKKVQSLEAQLASNRRNLDRSVQQEKQLNRVSRVAQVSAATGDEQASPGSGP